MEVSSATNEGVKPEVDAGVTKEESPRNQEESVVVEADFKALPNTPPVEIKLFVGRVPRTADENVLRPVFADFGVVSEIAIIKDRATGMHKGSAFVRMASLTQADAAIRALNNVKVLDPQLGALQVRYATGEVEKLGMTVEFAYPGQDQAKLFVGSLPRNISEDEVRELFSPCGQIDEVFIMKDSATGQGKGCAFVKFAYKEQAILAIKTLSGVKHLTGAPRPLEVRFAESKKALQSQQPSTGGTAAPTSAITAGQTPVTGGILENNISYLAGPTSITTGSTSGALPTAVAAGSTLYPTAAGASAQPATSFANCNPRSAGQWKEYFTDDGRPYYHNEQTSQTQWERPSEFDRQDVAGPPGANIFVFHVPNDWTQKELQTNFAHFGSVVSARIATDKSTGRNKGYAFVSYDNILSAAQAVQQMNGFLAGSKRLKVSIKQNEEIYVQHLLNAAAGPATSLPVSGNPAVSPVNQNLVTAQQPTPNASGAYRPLTGSYAIAPTSSGETRILFNFIFLQRV